MSYPNSALRPLGYYMRGDSVEREIKQEGTSEQLLSISSSDSSSNSTSSSSSSSAVAASNLPNRPPYIPQPIPTMPANNNQNRNQNQRQPNQNHAPKFTNGYKPGGSPADESETGPGNRRGVKQGDGPPRGPKAGVGRGRERGRGSGNEGHTGGRPERQDSGRHTPRHIDQYRPGPNDTQNRRSSWNDNQREDWQYNGYQHGGQRDNQPSTGRQEGRGGGGAYARGHGNHDTGRIEFTAADVHAAGTLIAPEPQRARGGIGKTRPLDPEKTNMFSRDRPKDLSSIVSATDAENLSFAFLCCLMSEERFARCAHCNTLQANYLDLAGHLKLKQCYKQKTFLDYIHLNDHAETLQRAKELVARDKSAGTELIHVLATYADDCMRAKGSNANQSSSRGSDQAAVNKAIADLLNKHGTNTTSRSTSNELAIRASSVYESTPASNSGSIRTGFDNAEDQDKFAFAFLASALEGDRCLGCRRLFDSLKEMEAHFRLTRHFENPTYQTLQSLPSYYRVLDKAREVINAGPRSEEKFFELLVARVYQIRDNTSSNNNNHSNYNTPPPAAASPSSRKRKTPSFTPIRVASNKHTSLFSHFDRIPESDHIRENVPGFTIRFLLTKPVREKPRPLSEDYHTYIAKRLAEQLSSEKDPHPNRPESVSIFTKPNNPSGPVYMDLYFGKQSNFMTAKERAKKTLTVDGDVIPVTAIGATIRLEKYHIDSRPLDPTTPSRPASFKAVISAIETALKPIGHVEYKLEDVWGFTDSSETDSKTVHLSQGLVIIIGISFPVAEYRHPRKLTIDGVDMSFEVRGRLQGKFSAGKRAKVNACKDDDDMDTS